MRGDLVPLRIDDPDCRGVTSSDGRRQYNKDARGRVWVPPAEARALLASGHRDTHRGELRLGMGMNPHPEHQIAYEAWLAARPADAPYVSYVGWFTRYRGPERGA